MVFFDHVERPKRLVQAVNGVQVLGDPRLVARKPAVLNAALVVGRAAGCITAHGTLIKMYDMFCLLEQNDLPSHNAMKLMVTKKVDMDLLHSAQTLSLSDFKELIKDHEIGTQDRTYKYEIVKRCVETNNISRVYGEELEEAIKTIKNE